VYDEGTRVGSFRTALVPEGAPVPADPPLPPALRGSVDGASAATPGSAIPTDAQAEARGFVLWLFDGRPARREPSALSLDLVGGSRRSAFIGIRALRQLDDVRMATAAAPTADPGISELPPAAVALWQIEGPETAAYMVPHSRLALREGQWAWLGLTVDATQLRPGRYGGRLAVTAGGAVHQVPFALTVHEPPAPAPGGTDPFGLWYLPQKPPGEAWAAVLAKLRSYGVSAVALPFANGGGPGTLPVAGIAAPVAGAQRAGLTMVSFSRAGGVLPPPVGRSERALLACSRPAWLICAEAASPTAAAATVQAGYLPAMMYRRLPAAPAEGLPAAPLWLVEDGCEPGRVPAMVASGQMAGDEAVWLYLDLTGTDWRRAATEVRSAAWAAAWQGLAGLAVRLPMPAREVDRQAVLWHIVRDACHEARTWRAAGLRADAEAQEAASAALDRVVGPDSTCDLPVVEERRPFRHVCRIGPEDGRSALSLAQFDRAYLDTLEASRLLPAASRESRSLFWDGVPVVENGRARCVLVAAEGEVVWKKAGALQQALEDETGERVPLSRTFPALPVEGPRLVVALAGDEVPAGWPDVARSARTAINGSGIAVAELEGEAKLLVIGPDVDWETFVAALRAGPHLFQPSRNIR
jgi:hypothetical protein